MIDSISCIIPTHARPDFLRESLESVSLQSLPAQEIIVVSDVDDPETAALCAEFARNSSVTLTYLVNAGSGASSSRNLGARAATGAVFAFLDDDDKWKPDYLRTAAEVLSNSGADGVATWIEMFKEGATAAGHRIHRNVSASQAASENPGVTGSNFLVRSEAFWRIDGFDDELPVKNDADFFFRFLLSGATYEVNARPEALQRKHSSGQLTGRTEFRAAGLEKYLAKHRAVLTAADRRAIRLAAARIRYHAATSKPKKVKQLLLGAVNSSPRSVLSSVQNRKTKDFWLVEGFGEQA